MIKEEDKRENEVEEMRKSSFQARVSSTQNWLKSKLLDFR